MAVLMPEPQGTALGLTTVYADQYDPKLLFPISRNIGRDAIGDHVFIGPNVGIYTVNHALLPDQRNAGIMRSLPIGTDIWRMYEFSWLNANGLPQAAEVDLFVPASSPSIIESKSLKLYQGSFAQTRFAGGAEQVAAILKRDLSNAAGAPVEVAVNTLDTWTPTIDDLPGELLEEAFPDVSITDFEVNPELLQKAPAAIDTDVKGNIRAAVWRTNLFRSLCPVTGQPDYASVSIALTGEAVDPRSLLKYLVSYRAHRGFHEQCVEQIFHDLRSRFTFTALEVQACFTRRGGIDINPYRSMSSKMPEFVIREGRQ